MGTLRGRVGTRPDGKGQLIVMSPKYEVEVSQVKLQCRSRLQKEPPSLERVERVEGLGFF